MFATIGNLGHLARIARTLARHDALVGIETLSLPAFVVRWVRGLARGDLPPRPGQRLAMALTALGPSFVKIGQALSIRADFVGEEIAADLTELQDHLAPFPAAAARATIETELGQPIRALFSEFEDVPVAAASIAQVHFAVTTEGEKVAVKVLRPEVETQFARDLALFRWLADKGERYVPALRRLRPREVVAKFAETIAQEMDLRLEASAAAELAENFKDDADLRIPRVDWARTARRVFTMARIDGIPVDERGRLLAAGHDPAEIVAKAARTFFRMVFRDGFFHADMHPGNIFVAPDGALIAVDFGIMGRIDPQTRLVLGELLQGFLGGDFHKVADVHFRAGFVPPDQSRDAFAQAARAIASPIFGKNLNDISLARLLAQLFEVTEQFQMQTQPQLLLLQKSMLVCEGVGRTLAPEINMWTLAEPLIRDWMAEHRGPAALAQETFEALLARLIDLPTLLAQAERATRQIAEGVKLNPEALAALSGRPVWPYIVIALLVGLLIGRAW